MSDTLRKIGLLGIGVISLTQEKIEQFVQEMTKKGEISKEEGKKLVKDILYEKEKQLKEIENKINEKVKECIKKSGFATKGEIDELKKRIEELENKLRT